MEITNIVVSKALFDLIVARECNEFISAIQHYPLIHIRVSSIIPNGEVWIYNGNYKLIDVLKHEPITIEER